MPNTAFHHLLTDFTKSLSLDLVVPAAEELESFEFIHDGTRCTVRPAGDDAHVIIEADALRLDSLPVLEHSQAVRFLHGLNRAALATNYLVATLDVDDEIRVSKSLPVEVLTAAALADEMVSAVEAARSLARSLELLSEPDDVRQEEAGGSGAPTAFTMPLPIQFA
jgi:hypothetical protein